MNQTCNTISVEEVTTSFDLGTFEGFSFRSQSAIPKNLDADGVLNWDHDRQGEAEFWPAGDNAGVALIFEHQSSVTGSELKELDRLLSELGDDRSRTSCGFTTR